MRGGALPRLHVLTDPWGGRRSLETVASALGAGAACIQVRAKELDDREHLAFAREVVRRCHEHDALCVVNDRLDIALASGADGVHLGARDLPVAVARSLGGDRLLVGGTARDPQTAAELVTEGADYLGTGPVYRTATKDGLPDPIGPEGLAAVVRSVDVPVIGISGVTVERVPQVLSTGAHGVAVTAAVSTAEDPAAATRRLIQRLPDGVDGRRGRFRS